MLIIEKIRHRYEPFIGDAQPIVADLTVSTAAELPALGAKIGTLYAAAAGTRADVIRTGMRYTLDADGKWYTSDAYETKSVSGGEITFTGTGAPLIDYTIRGNCVQDGTPTPDNPVYPDFCGVALYGQYRIWIDAAGQSKSVSLPEPFAKIGDYADVLQYSTQSLTQVTKKIVLTGDERLDTYVQSIDGKFVQVGFAIMGVSSDAKFGTGCICDSYTGVSSQLPGAYTAAVYSSFIAVWDERFTSTSDYRSFLSQRYAEGHPVTFWYVRSKAITESIELPEIPTVRGENTVTVTSGGISPSGIDIAYR